MDAERRLDAVLVIRADLVEDVMAHAREEHPHEACGIIAGPEGAERPERFIRMVNAAKPSGDEAAEAEERALRSVVLSGDHAEYQGEQRSSTTYYTFDRKERLRVNDEMDDRDEWPVVIYHSHTRSPAYPSQVDIDYASGPLSDPRIHYVIVSTREGAPPTVGEYEFRSFRIVDGEVTEEDVEVVESYMFSHTGADDVPDRA
ncbi:M67 family metallopeptidase [Pseudonocardia zijingensis]|uniref:M67 family metallopeptidase n=1 Tax=Pseudonocardia zijingensis TaxID=153376 RepID=A0ABN1N9F0_9PSEU